MRLAAGDYAVEQLEFQSTHPRRVRRNMGLIINDLAEFQSTHPRRVRHRVARDVCRRGGFNPRTHVGCDLRLLVALRRLIVSIHAPT